MIKSVPRASVDIGAPNSRSLSLATAYQATDPTKAALVTITISSTASLSLSGGETQTAAIVIGPTAAVAGGTGTTIAGVRNSLTGTVVVGVSLTSGQNVPATIALPAGWYFAVRQASGTITIASAYDQPVG